MNQKVIDSSDGGPKKYYFSSDFTVYETNLNKRECKIMFFEDHIKLFDFKNNNLEFSERIDFHAMEITKLGIINLLNKNEQELIFVKFNLNGLKDGTHFIEIDCNVRSFLFVCDQKDDLYFMEFIFDAMDNYGTNFENSVKFRFYEYLDMLKRNKTNISFDQMTDESYLDKPIIQKIINRNFVIREIAPFDDPFGAAIDAFFEQGEESLVDETTMDPEPNGNQIPKIVKPKLQFKEDLTPKNVLVKVTDNLISTKDLALAITLLLLCILNIFLIIFVMNFIIF